MWKTTGITTITLVRLANSATNAGALCGHYRSIVESCRRRGLDPHAYLHHVLTRLPSATNWQIANFTPEAWARSTASLPHAQAA